MRTAKFVTVISLAVLGLALPATGKTVRQPASYSEIVKLFLDATDSPVLFVGKITWVNSDLLPCTVANSRTTSWSVSKVLYGFDPGKKIDARFWSCGGVEDQFKSQDEMLVIAYPGYWNIWMGMKESVVPATDANIRIARKALDDYLRGKVRELVRPRPGGAVRPILAFEGFLTDLGPMREPGPCPSTVPPTFPVTFEVGQILRGSWTEKRVTVQFNGCGPLPSPTYRIGQHVLVFALRMEPEPPTFFRAGFLLPPEQIAEVTAALEKAESNPSTVRKVPKKVPE